MFELPDMEDVLKVTVDKGSVTVRQNLLSHTEKTINISSLN